MKKHFPIALLLMLTLATGLCLAAAAQSQDSLTVKEADDLRDTAQMPDAHTKLLLDFARSRLEAGEKLQSAPQLQPPQVLELRKLLYAFTDIIDQLDDNLDGFDDLDADLRMALRIVVESESDFQQRLRKLRETLPPAVLRQVNAELADAIEAVNDSAKSSRNMLKEQNQAAEEKSR